MKKALFAIGFFCVFFASAMEETPEVSFHIADAVPDGCNALTEVLIQYGMDGGSASVTHVDPANALRGLQAGKFQLLLVPETALPADFNGKVFPAFADALGAYVHVGNHLCDVPSEILKQIWTERRPVWSKLGGISAADIHRYAMLPGRPGGGMIQDFLQIQPPAVGVTLLNILNEPLLFVSADPEALALVRFQSEYPADTVKPLAIDGVLPSAHTVTDGSYKWSRRYVWALAADASPEAGKILPYCRGEKFRAALKKEDLLFLE